MRIAEKWFEIEKIDHRITRLWEPHVARVEQCNMWHVRGRDADLLVDAGMGIDSLKKAMSQILDKPVIAVATHTHMDHIGSLYELTKFWCTRLKRRTLPLPKIIRFCVAVTGLMVCVLR